MERAQSYAGVALVPFATHDQSEVARLEEVARGGPCASHAWLSLARCHDDHGRTAQAVLAYVRYALIDPAGAGIREAASRLWKLLVPEHSTEPATTSMQLPADTGDPWWQAELILATIRSTRHTGKSAAMSDERYFATALQGLVTFAVDLADATRMSDLWRGEVVPYFRKAMANGYLELMAYAVTRPLARPETLHWLRRHDASLSSLHAWSHGWPND